jgi:hypothetical protein
MRFLCVAGLTDATVARPPPPRSPMRHGAIFNFVFMSLIMGIHCIPIFVGFRLGILVFVNLLQGCEFEQDGFGGSQLLFEELITKTLRNGFTGVR